MSKRDEARCPKCGEPARYRTEVRVVRIDVYHDPPENQIGKRLPNTSTGWMCGGGHEWFSDAECCGDCDE